METSVHHNPGSVLNSPIQAIDHRDTLYSPTLRILGMFHINYIIIYNYIMQFMCMNIIIWSLWALAIVLV